LCVVSPRFTLFESKIRSCRASSLTPDTPSTAVSSQNQLRAWLLYELYDLACYHRIPSSSSLNRSWYNFSSSTILHTLAANKQTVCLAYLIWNYHCLS
jgi:hypothetical protein